jgi:caspase domain-containing protein
MRRIQVYKWLVLLCGYLLAFTLLAQPAAPQAGDDRYLQPLPIDRYALVVGVQRYESLEPVQNAINDAQVVGDALSKVRFKHVRVLHDPGTKQEILTAASEIAQLAGGPDRPATIVFYYAGHGFQFDGTNYLVPRRAGRPVRDPKTGEMDKSPLIAASIDIATIVNTLGSKHSAGATILFIDACRSEISAFKPAQPEALEQTGFHQGSYVENALVSFSTGFGRLAKSQGKSDQANSPYASALKNLIPLESLPLVPRLLVHVVEQVSDETNKVQVPDSEHPEVAGSYFFFQANDSDRAAELERWIKVLQQKRRKCVSTFLHDYRDGQLSQQAVLYLNKETPSPSDANSEELCVIY